MTAISKTAARPSRRDFLQVGTASLLGLSLTDLLVERAHGHNSTPAPASNCIFVWLAGGPATIDMWDMKPDAPARIRGEFHPIPSSVPGLSICEHLPEMAKVIDRCVLVRSVSHTLADHDPGTKMMVTGRAPSPDLVYPSLGAVASRFLPARRGVPAYMTLGDQVPGWSGFLGATGSAFQIRPADLAGRGQTTVPIELPAGFSLDDLERREKLLKQLDAQFAGVDRGNLADQLSTFEQQALDILRSNQTRRALALKEESETTRGRYGSGWAGQALLAARRLVEAGVGFVTASIGGWDTHADNFGQLRTALLPQLDKALAALIGDLDDRGLLKSTVVYCAGEFGRTPQVNGQGGRDHWARAMSVLLAGGRLRRGLVHGETDAQGMEPSTGLCSPADINATLLSLIGVSQTDSLKTPSGRPVAVFGEGRPVKPLSES